MKNISILKTLTGVSFLLLATISLSFAADANVPGDFATIQDAINDPGVGNGDTIFVNSGGPYGPLSIPEDVTILNNSAGTIIITNGAGTAIDITSGASPTIDGFEISGASASGITVTTGGTVTVRNCVITSNGTAGDDSGIRFPNAATAGNLIVEDTDITGNVRRGMTAVDNFGGLTVDLTRVNITNNGESGVFIVNGDISFTMTDCLIDGNGTAGFGHGIDTLALSAGTSFVLSGTNITNNNNRGVFLRGVMDFNATNGNITGNNEQGIMTEGGTPTVIVSGGSVSSNGQWNIMMDDPGADEGNQTLTVDGTTVNGSTGAGGVALFAQGTFTIQNATINNNTAEGIARLFNNIAANPSTILIENTTVQDNGSVGVLLTEENNVTVNDSVVAGNADGGDSQFKTDGGAAMSVTIRRTRIDNDTAGAGFALFGGGATGSHTIENSIVRGGGGTVGNALVETGGTVNFTHTTFTAAPGASAAGIFSGGGADTTFTLRDCIFDGVTDAIVNNRATNNWDVDFSLFNPTSSNIAGSDPGAVGGIGANSATGDPLFATATTGFNTGDFHLTAGSPALRLGTLLIASDFENNVRPNPSATGPDAGAFEAAGDIEPTSSTLDFGTAGVNNTVSKSLTVNNNGADSVEVSDLLLSGTDAGVFSITSPTSFSITGNSSANVSLNFTPDSATVFNDAQLEIVSNDVTSPSLQIALQGEGITNQDINLDPALLSFGNVTVGSSSQLSFQIQNVGSLDLSVTGVGLSGTDQAEYSLSGVPTTPFNIAASGFVSIDLTFTPGSAVNFNDANVDVTSDDPDEPTVSVDLDGSGVSSVGDWTILNME